MKNRFVNRQDTSSIVRERGFAHIKNLIMKIVARKGFCRVLDIGGSETDWRASDGLMDYDRVSVDLLSESNAGITKSNFRQIAGDVYDLSTFGDKAYDLCLSRSLFEFAGSWDLVEMASREIVRIADHYCIEAPGFWAPEQTGHGSTLLALLTEPLRSMISSGQHVSPKDGTAAEGLSMETPLNASFIDSPQLSVLFPDSDIIEEKFGFQTRSLLAVRA